MDDFNIESLPVKITYMGETSKDDWKCDQWRIELSKKGSFWNTDYFTGLGHRTKVKKNAPIWIVPKPQKPKVADVLYSLFLDASAADYNFDEWCDNYGESSDSIKALNMYKTCLETASVIKRFFDADTRAKIQSVIEEM